MKLRVFIACSLLSLSLQFCDLVYAESGDFYQKDFAINPLQKGVTGKRSTPAKKKRDDENEAGPENPEWSFEGDMLYPPKDAETAPTDLDAPKVQSIGVIVDVNNSDHFQAVAETLVSMSDAHDMILGTVWALSGTAIYMHPAYAMLHARGMIHNTVQKLPAKYSKVQKSPTYIVETEQGEILLEGVTKLERYINGNGQFIEKGMSLSKEVEPVKGDSF